MNGEKCIEELLRVLRGGENCEYKNIFVKRDNQLSKKMLPSPNQSIMNMIHT